MKTIHTKEIKSVSFSLLESSLISRGFKKEVDCRLSGQWYHSNNESAFVERNMQTTNGYKATIYKKDAA